MLTFNQGSSFLNPKLNKPRKFNYRPIYYDEDKEMHEELVEKVKKDLGIQDENAPYKPNIKGTFRQNGGEKITFNFRRREEKISHSKIILFVGLLFGIIYFLFLR